MTTKEELYKEIDYIHDESHLKGLLEWLQESRKKPVRLTRQQIDRLERSQKEIAEGQYVTHEDLRTEFDLWQEK